MPMVAMALVSALVFLGGALPSSEASSQPSTPQRMIVDEVKGIGLDAAWGAVERLSERAEDNNCKDPNSDWCQPTKNTNNIAGFTFGVLLFIGFIGGAIYLLKSGILDSILR